MRPVSVGGALGAAALSPYCVVAGDPSLLGGVHAPAPAGEPPWEALAPDCGYIAAHSLPPEARDDTTLGRDTEAIRPWLCQERWV